MLFNIYVWQWVMFDLQISYLFWSGLQVPAENTNWLWSESFWYSSESTDRWSSISWSGDTEFKSRSRCRVKCNIIVVKRYMFLHQAYDNGSKSHWSFGWEVETAVGFGTIKKTPPCLIAMSVPSLDPNSEHLPGNGDVSVRVKVSQGDSEQSVSQFVHIFQETLIETETKCLTF